MALYVLKVYMLNAANGKGIAAALRQNSACGGLPGGSRYDLNRHCSAVGNLGDPAIVPPEPLNKA